MKRRAMTVATNIVIKCNRSGHRVAKPSARAPSAAAVVHRNSRLAAPPGAGNGAGTLSRRSDATSRALARSLSDIGLVLFPCRGFVLQKSYKSRWRQR
jgi:hypothetical protein